MDPQDAPNRSEPAPERRPERRKAKLTKKLGTLPSESLREVEEGLKAAMDLD